MKKDDISECTKGERYCSPFVREKSKHEKKSLEIEENIQIHTNEIIHPIINRIRNKEKRDQINKLFQNAKQTKDKTFIKLLLEKVHMSSKNI